MKITCSCGERYQSKTAPCPDGIKGCLVAHYAANAHVCPACGTDNTPDLSKGAKESVGIGTLNLGSLLRLEIYGGEGVTAKVGHFLNGKPLELASGFGDYCQAGCSR